MLSLGKPDFGLKRGVLAQVMVRSENSGKIARTGENLEKGPFSTPKNLAREAREKNLVCFSLMFSKGGVALVFPTGGRGASGASVGGWASGLRPLQLDHHPEPPLT